MGWRLRDAGIANAKQEAKDHGRLLARTESVARTGSWFWDRKSHEVQWSDGLFRIFGLEPGSISPSVDSFVSRIHPSDRELFLKSNELFVRRESALPNGQLPRLRVRLRRQNDQYCLAELSGQVVLGVDGTIDGAIGVVQDISRTTETVCALQEASQMLRMANQIQGLASWKWNVVTGEVRWSDEMYTLLGYARDVQPSLPALIDALHPDDRKADRFCSRLALNADPIEVRFLRPDGSIRHVMSSFGTVQEDQGANPTMVIGVLVDISERRALEGELRQTRKMEALGRMAGTIAHDFNNYLTVTIGNADYLRESLPAQEGEMRTCVEEILKSAERCQLMTRRLLDLGHNRFSIPSAMDVSRLLKERASMLRGLAGASTTVRFNLLKTQTLVCLDEGHFEQVLMNLVTNARDAMPSGGKLLISTEVETKDDQEWVVVKVQDDGSGMDEETQERVFEPFFTTKAMGCGSGLGLASVFSIVQQHRGRVQIESELGRGTTVLLRFPRVAQETRAES